MTLFATSSYLNVSFNQLLGEIPSGDQLHTFTDPSFFIGSYHLCGFPLNVSCHENKKSRGPIFPGGEGYLCKRWR
ncbi:putative leucine-rich repeat domain superfamily [Dioscorea sansibarensis]